MSADFIEVIPAILGLDLFGLIPKAIQFAIVVLP